MDGQHAVTPATTKRQGPPMYPQRQTVCNTMYDGSTVHILEGCMSMESPPIVELRACTQMG